MKKEPGYYWFKAEGQGEWEVVQVDEVGHMYRTGNGWELPGEWGPRINPPTIECLNCGWVGQENEVVEVNWFGDEHVTPSKELGCPKCKSVAIETKEKNK